MRAKAIAYSGPRHQRCHLSENNLRIYPLQADSQTTTPVTRRSRTIIEEFKRRASDDVFEKFDGDGTPAAEGFKRTGLEKIAKLRCLPLILDTLLVITLKSRCAVSRMALWKASRTLSVDD